MGRRDEGVDHVGDVQGGSVAGVLAAAQTGMESTSSPTRVNFPLCLRMEVKVVTTTVVEMAGMLLLALANSCKLSF